MWLRTAYLSRRSSDNSWAAYVFAVAPPVQGATPAQGRLILQLLMRQLLGASHVKGPYAVQKLLELVKWPEVPSAAGPNSLIGSRKSRAASNRSLPVAKATGRVT